MHRRKRVVCRAVDRNSREIHDHTGCVAVSHWLAGRVMNLTLCEASMRSRRAYRDRRDGILPLSVRPTSIHDASVRCMRCHSVRCSGMGTGGAGTGSGSRQSACDRTAKRTAATNARDRTRYEGATKWLMQCSHRSIVRSSSVARPAAVQWTQNFTGHIDFGAIK